MTFNRACDAQFLMRIIGQERRPSKLRSCVDRVFYLCFCGGGKLTDVTISTIDFYLRNFVR